MFMKWFFTFSLFCLGFVSLIGCGGGQSKSAARAIITLKWPTVEQTLPLTINSIKVTMTQGTTTQSRIAIRPKNSNQSTLSFGIPRTGEVTIMATAFESSTATGAIQAQGVLLHMATVSEQFTAGFTLASPIVAIDVTPATLQLAVGDTVTLTAIVKDAAGDVVLLPPNAITWNLSASSVATVTDTGCQVTATMEQTGETTITATETASASEERKSDSTALTVVQSVSGTISGEVTWSGIMLMTGDVTIPAGASLTILPGTRVLVVANADDQHSGVDATNTELYLNGGTLSAVGTTNQPICFTSTAASPDNGDWSGLRITNPDLSFKYCTVEWASIGLDIAVGLEETVGIEQCTIINNDYGIFLSFSVLSADHCVISDNSIGIGGGQFNIANVTLTYTTIKNCSFGVLDINTFNADHCAITNNGWAVRVGSSIISNSTMSSNTADGVISTGSIEATNCTITANGGSGLCTTTSQGTITVNECQINGNGAGIMSSNDVTVVQSNVEGNTARGIRYGEFAGSLSMVTNSVIRDNGSNGIEEYSRYSSPLIVTGCNISNNGGSGIVAHLLSANNNQIVHNTASGIVLCGAIGADGLSGNLITQNALGISINQAECDIAIPAGNDIFGNMSDNLYNDSSVTVTANGNYWGPEMTTELIDGVENITLVFDHTDNNSCGTVTITSWVTDRLTGYQFSGSPARSTRRTSKHTH